MLEEVALIFSKEAAASARPAPGQNINISSKVQNVHKSHAATEHLEDEFLYRTFAEKSKKDSSSENLLDNFFTERHESLKANRLLCCSLMRH